ncbi:nicotinamide riboside transporter PnuC [Paenibacillus sp. ACRRX]|uniref:nicotinamide riboside transporter PnuC n=1 Tax=Paenibacillus sp. ACRRX TaxID=2918206 RepID=UPI001EF3F592|nr:nicotinamide riboside transporter PnuC [Paenibacillus sp. ACRRX]MCG7409672.1 nicotinamide riboside transporter PnuC [Paenibacillus sp. ACRRX]
MNRGITLAGLMMGMLLVAYWTSSSTLEIVATTTGLLSVWLTARENIWCWPIGLVNVACFFVMFYDAKLYADMTLQIFFFAFSVQGWIVWLTRRGADKVRPTVRMSSTWRIWLAAAIVGITVAWGYLLATYTDASIPYLDALVATLSLAAQYLLSQKIWESWYFWITVDVLSIGMYMYKGLFTVGCLYVVFLAIAIAGLLQWQRGMEKRQSGLATGLKQAANSP